MNNSFVNPIELLNLVGLKPDQITKEAVKKAKRIVIADVELSDLEEINFKGVLLTVVDVEYYASLLSKESNIKLYSDLLKFEVLNDYLYGSSLEKLLTVIKEQPLTVENYQSIVAEEFKDIFRERTRAELQRLYRKGRYTDLIEVLHWIESVSEQHLMFLMNKMLLLLHSEVDSLKSVSSEIQSKVHINALDIDKLEVVINHLPPKLIAFFDERLTTFGLANKILVELINLSVFLHKARKRNGYALKCSELGEKYTEVDTELWALNWTNKKVYLDAASAQKKKKGIRYGVLALFSFWILVGTIRNFQSNNDRTFYNQSIEQSKTAFSNSEYSKAGKISPHYAENMYESISYMNLPYTWSSGGIDLSFPLPNFFHSGIDEKRTYFIKVNQNWSWEANQFVLNKLITLDKKHINKIKEPRSAFPIPPQTGSSPFDFLFKVERGERKVKIEKEHQGKLLIVNASNYDQVVVFYKAETVKPVRSCYVRSNDSTTISLKEYYYSISTMSGVNWVNDCISLESKKVGGFSNLLTFHQFNPVYLFVSGKQSKKGITRIKFKTPEQVVLVDEKGKSETISLTGVSASLFFRRRVLSYLQS